MIPGVETQGKRTEAKAETSTIETQAQDSHSKAESDGKAHEQKSNPTTLRLRVTTNTEAKLESKQRVL